MGEDGGEELLRVVSLENGGLVGFHAVGRGVGPAEGIALKPEEQAPDFSNFLRRPASCTSGTMELATQPLHGGKILLDEGTAQDIGAPGIKSGESLADLKDMLLVGDQAEGGAENGFQGGMEGGDRGEALVTLGKLLLFELVGSAGADDGNDSDQAVDIPGLAHPVECGHGGAFHVVDAAGPTGSNHLPDFGILPRGELLQIEWRSGQGWNSQRTRRKRCGGSTETGVDPPGAQGSAGIA